MEAAVPSATSRRAIERVMIGQRLGALLRERLEVLGLTQQEFAAAAGIDLAQASGLIRGRTPRYPLLPSVVAAMARVLQVDQQEILAAMGYPYPVAASLAPTPEARAIAGLAAGVAWERLPLALRDDVLGGIQATLQLARDAAAAADEPAGLALSIVPTAALTTEQRAEIVALCARAFAKDFADLFDYVTHSLHVLARREGRLVGHACWSHRWLQPEGQPPLESAYVDAVATEPDCQRQGIGRAVMEHLAAAASGYQLNALHSNEAAGFYERLGWERWRGPTALRTASGLERTPGEIVLIRRTATTPALDLAGLLVADWRAGDPW